MLYFADRLNDSLLSRFGSLRYGLFDRNYRSTFRALLIGTCLILTILVAALFSLKAIVGVLAVAGVLGMLAVLYLYHHMEQAMLIVIFVTTAMNLGIPTGTDTNIMLTWVLLVVLTGIWLFKLIVAERSFKSVRPTPLNGITVLFAIVVIISFFWSLYYVEPEIRLLMEDKVVVRIMTGVTIAISPIAALLFGNFVRSEKALRWIVWCFVIVGVVAAVLKIVSLHANVPSGLLTIINGGGQFPTWVTILILGQVLFNPKISPPLRVLMMSLYFAWCYIVIGLGITWLSGWVPVIVGSMIIAVLRSWKLFLVILLALAVYLAFNTDFVHRMLERENQESGVTRLAAADRAMEIFGDHFLFGTGPAGYQYYMTIKVDWLYQLSHDNYVDILSQLGIVGILVYLSFWGVASWTAWRAFRTTDPRNGFLYGLSVSLLAANAISLMCGFLGDWITPFPYTQGLSGISYTIWHWIMVGLALALLYYNRQLAPSVDR